MNIEALREISYGLYVISSKLDGKKVGCIVNTVTQITSQNPIISVSINKENTTNVALREHKKFSISILSEETNPEVIGTFGFYSSKEVDKFKQVSYEEIEGLPVIKEKISGYLLCEVIQRIEVETHDIFLARVLNTQKEEEYIPMTYRYYHNVIKGKAPKKAPTYIEENILQEEKTKANQYKCLICGYIYDDAKESVKFEDLPEDWICPLCKAPKSSFQKIEE